MTVKTISPTAVRRAFLAREEIALIDLREEASFAVGHPLFAAQLSVGCIELEVLDRIPRKDTLVVLYDNGEGLVPDAARRLAKLGYTNLAQLEGGVEGWVDAGFELFQDVNSYSKAFGELVEHRRHTPSLSAQDVQRLMDSNADIRILDARRFDEYATMSIPAGISAPGAELVLRAAAVAPDLNTTIIVNCAGRTRSIIGAQSLVNARLPNPVFALRNGTIGWALAGQKLEFGQSRVAQMAEGEELDEARARAREVAYRAGVRCIGWSDLEHLSADSRRTLYRFDVRTPEEFHAGHIGGFRNAPGGQLVQEIDMWAPVRGARMVLVDDIGPRADMTAFWLAQMGWEVYVLEGPVPVELEPGFHRPLLPEIPEVVLVEPEELAVRIGREEGMVIDLAPSREHAAGHIPGARFALRAELTSILAQVAPDIVIALSDRDGTLASFAAADIRERECLVLRGGTAAWMAAGLSLEQGMTAPLSEPRDRYKRPYEGTDNAEVAMQAYLEWEYGLVQQLERDGTHGFYVI